MVDPTPPRRGPTPTTSNHYVPEWYQKRFLVPGETQFHYLDLRPDRLPAGPGRFYYRNAMRRLGPANCFARDHLYTLKLGRWMTDMVEHGFFKQIDGEGMAGVALFSDFDLKDGFDEAWHGLMAFMDAERYRTPRGLEHLSKVTRVSNHNALLIALQRIFQQNATMWAEGIWEVVTANNSKTKLLLTDNPVTFYNARAFPGAQTMAYPYDALLGWLGTRTIFPLDLNTCLIITHREFTRNPWKPPLRARINARSYASSIFDAQGVQTGRVLEEDEVLRINVILKKRADRYVAACKEEWLYPERHISTSWSQLDDDWFLMPNLFELHLGGSIFVGYEGGHSAGWDEYGFAREHPQFEKRERDETKTHRLAQREWGAKRLLRSVGISNHFHHRGRKRPFWDSYVLEEIEDYLARGKRPGGLEVLEKIKAYRAAAAKSLPHPADEAVQEDQD